MKIVDLPEDNYINVAKYDWETELTPEKCTNKDTIDYLYHFGSKQLDRTGNGIRK